jgi:diaminopimelate epimerase
MRFSKYHGLGNDFVLVDLRRATSEESRFVQDPALVRAICDRQFGIGADGVLPILPSTQHSARMRVLNADGSEAEMCGNGIRCVVKYLHERGGLAGERLEIDTGAGSLRCVAEVQGGIVTSVTVDMGRPRFTRGEIPMVGAAGERCIEQIIDLGDNAEHRVTCVSMGNPHAVSFVPSRDEARRRAERLGPIVERHAWFPHGANAGFAHIRSPREIDLVVWERGSGLTLACGTGACAAAVAACLTGRAELGAEITLHLLGGDLHVTVATDYSSVSMRGGAHFVYDGELDPAAVVAAARPR